VLRNEDYVLLLPLVIYYCYHSLCIVATTRYVLLLPLVQC